MIGPSRQPARGRALAALAAAAIVTGWRHDSVEITVTGTQAQAAAAPGTRAVPGTGTAGSHGHELSQGASDSGS